MAIKDPENKDYWIVDRDTEVVNLFLAIYGGEKEKSDSCLPERKEILTPTFI